MTIEEMKAAQTRAVNEARQVAHDLVDPRATVLRARTVGNRDSARPAN